MPLGDERRVDAARGTDAGPKPASALDPFGATVYAELRALAGAYLNGRARSHTLQPTALVHEAWIKLAARGEGGRLDRSHYVRTAARAMRQILVDHARAAGTAKRGAGGTRVDLDELRSPDENEVDLVALDEALERLAELDIDLARIVELRFFAGLTEAEIATALGRSRQVVERRWRTARLWLEQELREHG